MSATYKILLVEADSSKAYIYKNMLPWEKYQFEITLETDNEIRAVAMFGEYRHDMVICDLDLKDGDGFSVMRAIKKINPNCIMVVISDRIDYASVREAFLCGCYDFLEKKNLHFYDLENMLIRAKKDLDARCEHFVKQWQTNLEYLLGMIRDKQQINEASLLEALSHPELMLLQNPYQMFFFRIDNIFQINHEMRKYNGTQLRIRDDENFGDHYREKLRNKNELQKNARIAVEKVFSDIPEHRLVFTKQHSGLVIVPVLDPVIMKEKLRHLRQLLIEHCFYSYSVTLGSIYSGSSNFMQAYQQIMDDHEWKFYYGDGCVLEADELPSFQSLGSQGESYQNRLVKYIESLKTKEAIESMNSFYSYIQEKGIYPSEVKQYMAQILNRIEKYAEGKGIVNSDLFSFYRTGIRYCDSLVFMKSEVERILQSLIDYLKDHHVNEYSKKVNQIIRYINENIGNKITLTMIANFSGFSEIHTSRMFKKEVGMGLVEYVNLKKMEKAKDLLETSNMKIKEIAHYVGIQDQLYFNKLFHKQYKQSPSEYRKHLKIHC